MRILHSADWQIGKGFGRIPGDAGALIREQRLQTVQRIAALAAERAVDAVLVAGDVLDQQTVSDRSLRRLAEALAGYTGPWVLLPGNHDAALAESVWTRLRALRCLPGDCHLALTPEPLLLADGRLAVLPAPLRRRHEAEDLTAWFDRAQTPPGVLRVGLAHGTVQDRLPTGAERHNPIAADRAETARLDYLALGDWHGTLEIAPRTWYAGTPETDGFRRNDSGNCLLVELTGSGAAPRVERIPTSHYHWHLLEETVASDAAVEALEVRLAGLGEPSDRQVLRLRLTGSLSLGARERLDELLARWSARLRLLDVDAAGLQPQASEAELAALRGQGFIGSCVERLLALHERAGDPQQPHAMDALQRLHAEYRRLEEGG